MSDFTIRQATRTGVKPAIGMYGKSGSGKSMSALLFMRGIVGPKGRITLIDSESGRGSLFADIIPGGYQVIDLEPPFSPERYLEAFNVAEAQSDGVIFDSMSHEHAGEGGVLDQAEAELDRMAGDNYQKREACKMASWIKPKLAHKKFIQRILRSKVPLICCLRGDEKTHMVKDQGKNKVITDEFSTPIFDQRFVFELLLSLETIAHDGKGGFIVPRKITHPSIESILPSAGEQISIKHGELLSQWCSATGVAPADPAADLRKEIWALTKPYRDKADKTWGSCEGWLLSKGLIKDGEEVKTMDRERLNNLQNDIYMATDK